MLTFDNKGEPQLRAIPSGADVFTPESLPNWIHNPFGARSDFLPVMLQAIGKRLSSPRRRRIAGTKKEPPPERQGLVVWAEKGWLAFERKPRAVHPNGLCFQVHEMWGSRVCLKNRFAPFGDQKTAAF
ncbi:hypothetical protein SAMN04244579_03624 [Azotobacter beijerinckii]|uniref:Uncharacterized protein n=1 Tax=Azotobacter beijerinckii TaxID=170623 RepID=A0A1H6X4V5_9GAMM|nr:hypothetical protein [Azotobacter beijerinckii]SEJ24183.1 hypothetical protein SAMN04244579_03624 [Azotobacter beijerinckii]